MKVRYKILIFTASVFLIIFSTLCIYVLSVTKDSVLSYEKLNAAQTVIDIYDKDGEAYGRLSPYNVRESVKIEEVNEYTKNAFISIEDKNFYKHHGLNYKRMASALINNVKSRKFKEGASTISQQLIKNTHLSPDKTIKRKLNEIKLTVLLEKSFSKDEIMEMYLNSIYFGHNSFGIKDASKFYFDKTPSALSLAESATLAAIIKSPNNYSPFKNPEACLNRRNFVLKEMLKEEFIDANEYSAAIVQKLPENYNSVEKSPYLNEVLNEAEQLFDGKISGEVKIYTYLDKGLQEELERINGEFEGDKTLMVTNNKSLGVTAFFSTLDSKLKRSPASIIKPLAVYAPAIELDAISAATKIRDEKINYGGYSPSNYKNKYHGDVSVRESIVKSLNIPAVKIMNSIGVDTACDYLEKMDLIVESSDRSLSLALGGMSEGFSLKSLSDAYTVFSNEGNYERSKFIERIVKDGKTVYERKINKKKIFSFESVTIINDTLIDVAKSGTAKKLKDLDYEICAKTGTHSVNGKNTDAYTISYTSKNTVSVWFGDKNNEDIKTTGGGIPCIINKIINEYLYFYTKPVALKKSSKVINIVLDKYEYDKNGKLIRADDIAPKIDTVNEMFKKSAVPKEKSTKYSRPEIYKEPMVNIKKNGLSIVLCDAYYTKYCIVRIDESGRTSHYTVYGNEFFDEDIKKNEIYTYSITPYFGEIKGRTKTLPKVKIKIADKNTDDDQNLNFNIKNKSWWNE